MRTRQADSNSKKISLIIRFYDSDLKLKYSNRGGFYYITRPIRNFNEKEGMDLLDHERGSGIYSDAVKDKEVIVCWPISVKMMDHHDVALRNIMRHLKENDMRTMGVNSDERIKKAEGQYDNESYKKQLRDASHKDNVKNFGKEYWRDKIRTHAYFDLRGI